MKYLNLIVRKALLDKKESKSSGSGNELSKLVDNRHYLNSFIISIESPFT